jgi:UDP-glucose 4-epimerase
MFENLKRKNIVVTGANGLIGRAICEYFELHDFVFTAVSRSKNNYCYSRYLELDLTIPGSLDNVLDNNTIVFHCASSTDVRASVEDPYSDLQSNFLLFFQVLESIKRCKSSLVFMSSGSVYNDKFVLPKNEDSNVCPSSPYSAGKLSAEYYCKVYVELFDLDIKIMRIFSIYGVGIKRFVIFDLISKLASKPSYLKIKGSGEEMRDFIHISDLVNACCFVAEYGKPGEVYNVASGKSISIINLAILIKDLMNLGDIEIIKDSASFSGDNKALIADISKLEMLGFKNNKTFIGGLSELIEKIQND